MRQHGDRSPWGFESSRNPARGEARAGWRRYAWKKKRPCPVPPLRGHGEYRGQPPRGKGRHGGNRAGPARPIPADWGRPRDGRAYGPMRLMKAVRPVFTAAGSGPRPSTPAQATQRARGAAGARFAISTAHPPPPPRTTRRWRQAAAESSARELLPPWHRGRGSSRSCTGLRGRRTRSAWHRAREAHTMRALTARHRLARQRKEPPAADHDHSGHPRRLYS